MQVAFAFEIADIKCDPPVQRRDMYINSESDGCSDSILATSKVRLSRMSRRNHECNK